MFGLVKASTLAAAQAQIEQLAAEVENAELARLRAVADGARDVAVWSARAAELDARLGNAERGRAALIAAHEEAMNRVKQDKAVILAAAERAAAAAKRMAEEVCDVHSAAMADASDERARLAAAVAEERAANDKLRAELAEMRKGFETVIASAAAIRTEADAVASNLRRQAQEHAEQLAASNRAHKAEAGALRREVDSLRASR